MKKLLLLSGAALFMVACNQTPEQIAGTSTPYIQQQAQQSADTAGLAAYNAWKAQNELADINDYMAQQETAAPVKKAATVKRTSAPVKKAVASKPAASRPSSSSSSSNNDVAINNTGISDAVGQGTETTQEKKEGWSKAAKGAVIGGVAGAAGGAVINKKNRVVGAVIGAVIGAGGGYVVGRKMDKKDGRIELN